MWTKYWNRGEKEMRHCPNCRNLLHDHATYCPKCHMTFHKTSVNDDISFGLAILGFLVPLLGILLYLVWQDKYPKRAKSCAIGAWISIFMYAIHFEYNIFGVIVPWIEQLYYKIF